MIPSSIIASKLKQASDLAESHLDDRKVWDRKLKELTKYLSKSLEYEEKNRICGPDRNSYYKTDHDATAMCLKEDYYSGLGSNLHAAYGSVGNFVSRTIITGGQSSKVAHFLYGFSAGFGVCGGGGGGAHA